MLDGEIPMHKFKTNPAQLEMMLDQYWEQDPFYVLSALIKTGKPIKLKEDNAKPDDGVLFVEGLKGNSISPMRTNKDLGIVSHWELGNDTLQDQIDQSGDRLVNKILYYLSNLPIQYSMFQLTQKFDEMVTFTRFEDYLSKAFESTDQMKNIDVLKTDLDEGM